MFSSTFRVPKKTKSFQISLVVFLLLVNLMSFSLSLVLKLVYLNFFFFLLFGELS